MTLATWPLTDELKHHFSFYSQFFAQDNKAAGKQTQHWCATTPSIVGCYMLHPFVHPVACCCAKFETGQTFQPTTPNISFVL